MIKAKGRRINDNMGKYVAENVVKMLIKGGVTVKGSNVLVLGLTFKENISDIRNTKVLDIYNELMDYGINVYIHDPYAYKDEVREKYDIELIETVEAQKPYDAIILAVKHLPYVQKLALEQIKALSNGDAPILVDIKALYSEKEAHRLGFSYWRL